jgi:ribosomal protein S18 acetylase RimI-like enzyme
MLIRSYRPEDLDTLRGLTVAAFEGVSIDHNIEKEFGEINGRNWKWRKGRHVDADAAAHPEGIFVAELDGWVAGYISTRLDRESGIGWIPNLVVADGLRGQGLGRKLIEHALGYFRANGMTMAKIETLDQNPIGQHLYPACGFKEAARQIHYVMKIT